MKMIGSSPARPEYTRSQQTADVTPSDKVLGTKKHSVVPMFAAVIVSLGLSQLWIAQAWADKPTHYWNFPEAPESTGITKSKLKYIEIEDAIAIRNTEYRIRVPENWNGTLISDLDYHRAAESPKHLYLLEHGYALSGTLRRPDRLKNYDPAHEIHDLVSVLDVFEAKFGKPKRTIQFGCSGGGNVAIGMAEIHPDRIDGAISAGAPTSPWFTNTSLDGFVVLRALIAPELPIVNLPLQGDEIKAIGAAWREALENAQKTPEGRARIALAVTIGQWPGWGGTFGKNASSSVPEPEPSDADALQTSMYQTVSLVLPSERTFGHTMLELAAPGQLRWNTGIDYREFFENGNPLYQKAVRDLYKKAGLSLENDLKQVNSSPRVKADPEAIRWWSAPGRTHVGKPKVPLLRLHNNGDLLVYPSMVRGYESLVAENGYSDLFRSAYVNRAGHCTYSVAEFAATIETLEGRIETGEWPSTDPKTLNALGKSLDSSSATQFYEFTGVKKYNRVWLPDANDFIGKPHQ